MIPKIIHYVWLSGDVIPPQLKTCMDSWHKIMPDYKIKCWTKNNFDICSVPFVTEACKEKKWAFACDYIRLYALYTEGGIYLDSDVLIKKSLDEYILNDFFTSVEFHPTVFKQQKSADLLNEDGTSKSPLTPVPGIGIQAAILGSIKGHLYVKKCMDYYIDKHFINDDGSLNDETIAPSLYAFVAEDFGFRYIDKMQLLSNNMLVLPSNIFASTRELDTPNSVAVHCCAGSWRVAKKAKLIDRVINKVKKLVYLKPTKYSKE